MLETKLRANLGRRASMALLVLPILASSALIPASVATAAPSNKVDPEIDAKIIKFAEENPDDLTGLDELTYKYTGKHVTSRISGINRELSAAEGESILRSREKINKEATADAATDSDASTSVIDGTAVVYGGIPTFSANITWAPLTGRQAYVYGGWKMDPKWAGQNRPEDVATLQFLKGSCVTYGSLATKTTSYRGTSTGLGYIKDANLGSSAPIFGINDKMSNFEMQAYSGWVRATLNASKCAKTQTVQSAFTYEANSGSGKVLGVSAGWGAFSVSYEASPLVRRVDSQPISRSL